MSAVKCAKCNVALQGPSISRNPEDVFSCPICGVSDTFENIMREAQEYFTEKTGGILASYFEKVTRGNKFLTFKKSRRHKKAHRFIVEMDLH